MGVRSVEEISLQTIAVENVGLVNTVRAVGDPLNAGYRDRARVFMGGNGGSAADGQHFVFDRLPLSAEALPGNTPRLTAVADYHAYETVPARALGASAKPGDSVVAVSTSAVATLGEQLPQFAEFPIDVPSSATGRVEESPILSIHATSEHVEHAIFAPQS